MAKPTGSSGRCLRIAVAGHLVTTAAVVAATLTTGREAGYWFCEGQTYVTRLGLIYSAKPAGVQTELVRRCRTNGPLEHFDSNSKTCEGQDSEGILGYALS
ncbi:hypothetical protein AB0M87_23765 [Streptomyces sp. NPDC051320]|uniref:hypothetical protein n=1 Tax=Streptomyces sp. NPDC051320 TaxID=3154644 RepID=UPI00342DDD49